MKKGSDEVEQQQRNDQVVEYLPLVQKVVHTIKVNNKDYDHEDLVNIGVIGLMDAIDRYDESQKVPFQNYAYIRIKGAIIDEIRRNSRIPRSRMDKLNEYYKAKEALELELKRTPTEQEIIQRLDVSAKEMESIYDTFTQLASVSLDEVLYTDSDSDTSMMDVIEDKKAINSEENLLLKEKLGALSQAIGQLNERDQQILQLIYVEELGMKDIAYILNISKARVSQLHGKALIKLREQLEGDYHD